jgi:hypothetical protein
MMTDSPVPTYFGWRYILWLIWSNLITGLMTLQAIFAALTLNPDLVPHNVFHWILISNAVLCVAVAQIKQRTPVPDRPVANTAPPSKSESP